MEDDPTFWSLLRDSVIVQSVVTALVICTICYLYITQANVPDTLFQLAGIVIGFWMGSKVQHVSESSTLARYKARLSIERGSNEQSGDK